MLLPLLIACATPPHSTDTSALADSAEPPAFQFSFVVIADPHVSTGPNDHPRRLEAAVDWINTHADPRQIEFVAVVGDIGWSAGLEPSKALLDGLRMPYIPVMGDNEIQAGDEARFETVFAPVFARLEQTFDDYARAPVPVFNPEWNQDSWFQNQRMRYRGLTLVGLDWSSRHMGGLLSEKGELHAMEGGTLDWLAESLPDEALDESVVLFSHIPMHLSPGGFNPEQIEELTALTAPKSHLIAANYAGHYHFDLELTDTELGYDVFVTDATWDDVNRVRLVEVWRDDEGFSYMQEVIEVE